MTAYRDSLGSLPPQDGEDIHRLPFRAAVLGRPGFLHGGAIAGFLTVACDARAAAEGGDHQPTTSSMNFLRGGRERDTFARAQLVARTSRLLVIEAAAWQESPERPIATMSRTYLRRA